METDRSAVLTIRAAVRGVLDFKKANTRDRQWTRLTRLVLREMEKQDVMESLRLAFAFKCALVSNADLDAKSFEETQKQAIEYFNTLKHLVLPWGNSTTQSAQEAKIAELKALYAQYFEDPNTPEFQAKLRHDLALQEAAAAANTVPVETEEQRIVRLTQARDAYLASMREKTKAKKG